MTTPIALRMLSEFIATAPPQEVEQLLLQLLARRPELKPGLMRQLVSLV